MKTILIRAQVPDGFNENLISVTCVHNKYIEPVNFEIVTPPTEEEIRKVVANYYDSSELPKDEDWKNYTFGKAIWWVLKRLGL